LRSTPPRGRPALGSAAKPPHDETRDGKEGDEHDAATLEGAIIMVRDHLVVGFITHFLTSKPLLQQAFRLVAPVLHLLVVSGHDRSTFYCWSSTNRPSTGIISINGSYKRREKRCCRGVQWIVPLITFVKLKCRKRS